ncbi:hypothetical protein TNCV_4353641 [Trichonephila clavipes]|nr:hypothetical protein TNCV_4353641 [Trichonephila clavipes]
MCSKNTCITSRIRSKTRGELVNDALIYAKRLCEELEISFEPQDESGGSIYLATEGLNDNTSHCDGFSCCNAARFHSTPVSEREKMNESKNTTEVGGLKRGDSMMDSEYILQGDS